MNKLIRKIALTASALCAFSFMSCNDLAEDILVQPSDWSEGKINAPCYLMASIGTSRSQNSDALHLAISDDGLNWKALNSNNSIFIPDVGSGHIREPYIFRKNDGTFVMLAADYTTTGQYNDLGSINNKDYAAKNNRIVVSFSDDLVTWTNGHYLQVTNASGRQAWTPKALYNKEEKCYDIYWVGQSAKGYTCVYKTQTFDFITVKDMDEHLVYDAGYAVTGAFAVKDGSAWYMATVDARDDLGSRVGFDVQLAKADSGTWGEKTFLSYSSKYINRLDSQNRMVVVRNPTLYQLPDGVWVMLATKSNNPGSYQIIGTTDINDVDSWVDYSSRVNIFANHSGKCEDASVSKITRGEYYKLLERCNQ